MRSILGWARKPRDPRSASPELQGAPDLADPRLAAAMIETVLRWSEWCHRRIDRYEAEGGNRGRTKHSIDMTLPIDTRLAYDVSQRSAVRPSEVKGSVIAPLALLAKEPLHEFDVSLTGAGSVPMLTRSQNETLVVAMLVEAYGRVLGDEPHPLLREALGCVVGGTGAEAWPVAVELTEQGTYKDQVLFKPNRIDTKLLYLTRDLASGFLLCVLLPSDALGIRSLVKLSHLWRTDTHRAGWWARNVESVHDFELTMTAASDTESYHFEFIVPRGVQCRYLAIPEGDAAGDRHLMKEARDTTVHLHANYAEPPGPARVVLTSIGSAPRRMAFWWLVATALLCWVLVSRANFEQLVTGGGSGISLLLSLPALLLGIAAARFGPTLADALNWPSRLAAGVCAGLLFAEAAGPLIMPSGHALWLYWLSTAGIATGLLGLAFLQTLFARQRMASKLANLGLKT